MLRHLLILFEGEENKIQMHIDIEKKEIVFESKDIVQMITPMMPTIAEKNRELHDSNVAPRSIFIPIEGIKLIGLQIRTH